MELHDPVVPAVEAQGPEAVVVASLWLTPLDPVGSWVVEADATLVLGALAFALAGSAPATDGTNAAVPTASEKATAAPRSGRREIREWDMVGGAPCQTSGPVSLKLHSGVVTSSGPEDLRFPNTIMRFPYRAHPVPGRAGAIPHLRRRPLMFGPAIPAR